MCETNIKEMGRENISSTPKSAEMPHYGEKRMFSCFGTSIQPRTMILVSNPMFSGTANLKKTYFQHNWMVIEGSNSNLRLKITSSDPYLGVISALSCPNHVEINILRVLDYCLTCHWSHWCAQIICGTYINDTGNEKVSSNP